MKNLVVKVVRFVVNAFIGVAMADAVHKYIAEPLQKKIDSMHEGAQK